MKNRGFSKYILTAAVFLALSGGMAWGAAYTWTGGGSGVWELAANWGGGGYPVAGDTATINTAAVITTSTPITVFALTINAGATLNLGNTLTVTGNTNNPNENFRVDSTNVTINTNGHAITAGWTDFGKTVACSLSLVGTGTWTTATLDTNQTTNNYVTMTNGAKIVVSTQAYFDQTGSTATFFSGDGSCSITLPNNVNASPDVVFDGVSVIYGGNTYTVSHTGAAALGQTISISITGTPAGSSTYRYQAEVNSAGAADTYVLDGTINITGNVAPTDLTTTAGNPYTTTLFFQAVDNNSDYILLTFFVPGGTNIPIGTLRFVNNTSATTWIGGFGGNEWNDAANWTGGVPTNTSTVVIPQLVSGNYPIVTGTAPTAATITINSGASLTLNTANINDTTTVTNNGTIYLAGTQTISGTHVNGPSSTIVYTGAAANPTAWGTSYRNLTVTGTLTLGATSITVAGTLENSGTIVVNGAGTVNKSDNNSGTFQYSTAAGTIPALDGYNTLQITTGTHAQSNNLSAVSLSIGGGAALQLGSRALSVTGAFTNAGTLTLDTGSATVGSINNSSIVEINDTGTINLSDNDSGIFRYSGTSVSIPALSGYQDLEITAGAKSASGPLTINGNLSLSGGATTSLASGTNAVHVYGNATGTGSETWTAGSGTVTLDGSFSGIAFSQTGGTLALNGAVPSFAPGGSLGSLEIGGTANVTLGAPITVTDNLTVLSGGSLDAGGQIITVNGNWTDSGTFTAAGGTVIFAPDGASALITGNTIFNDLSSTLQAGKTLTIANDITVQGSLTLSGTGTGAGTRLFINGAGSITLASDQAGGSFLSVGTNIDIIAGHTYTAYQSVPTSLPRAANWNLMANTAGNPVWTGTLGTNWNAGGNWDSGAVPGPGENATVGNPEVAGNNPQATAAVTTGTINVLAAGSVDFHGETITVTAINNSGVIALDGTAGQVTGLPTIANDGTSAVTYTGALATPIMGTSYQNLTVITGAILSLGGTTINVDGTLAINGGLNLNGAGSITNIGTIDNLGTIEISSTGTIPKSDPDSGTFRYATATGSLPALDGYNALVVASGTWTATAALSATGISVLSTASLDLGTFGLNAFTGTFSNSGIVRISGNPSIGGTKSNVAGSTVEYYGTGCAPAWGTGYANLSITGEFIAGGALTATEAITVSGTASASFNANAAGQTTECATATLSTTGSLSLGNDAGDIFRVTGGAFATPTASGLTLAGTLTASGGITLRNINTVAANITFTNGVTLAEPVTLALGTSTLTINSGITCTTNDFETTYAAPAGLVTVSAGAAITTTDGALTFANPVTLGNGASIASSGSGTINLNTTGTTNIGTGASVASTGTGKITFAGTVINNGAVSAGNTGAATAIEFGGGYSGTGAINGNGTGDPVILFSGAGAAISIATIAPAGDTVRFSGASQSITPGASNTYANVECSGSGISFGNNAFTQGTTANFTVSAGTVSIGTGQFIAGNLIASGGTFTQTGLNAGTQSATTVTASGGSIEWDANSNGGTLSIGGGITGTAATILFHQKSITFTATGTLQDAYAIYAGTIGAGTVTCHAVFRDLTINNGATLIADGGIRVTRNLTLQDGSAYTPGGNTLTLGGTGSETGSVWDNHGTPISLGAVDINAINGPTIKTAQTQLSFSSLAISAGTFASGTNTITVAGNVDSTAGSWTSSGLIDVGGNLAFGPGTGSFTAGIGSSLQVAGNLTFNTVTGGTNCAVTLDGTGNQQFTTNAVSIASLSLTTGGANAIRVTGNLTIAGTGALAVNAGQTLDLDTDDASLTVGGLTTNNGAITGGAADIIFTGNYAGGSGSFTAPAAPNVTRFRGNATFNATTSTLTHNNGTVIFDGGGAQILVPGGDPFNALTVSKATGTFTVDTNALTCDDALTVTNSQGCAFNMNVDVDTLILTATTGTIAFNGDLVVNTGLTNAGGNFNLTIAGATNSVAGNTTIGTTGTLTISNGCTFSNGLTATAPAKTVTGTVTATAGDIVLWTAVPPSPATAISGTAGFTGTAAITLGAITSAGGADNLTVTNGTGTVTFNAAIGAMGNYLDGLTLAMGGAGTVTFADGATAYVTAFNPGGGTYALAINSNSATFTNNVSFTSSGSLTLGDDGSGSDTLTFANGVTATSQTKNVAAVIQATAGTIDLGSMPTNVTANARIGGTSTGQITLDDVNISPGATLTLGNGAASPVTAGDITGAAGANLTVNVADNAANPLTSIGNISAINVFTVTQSSGVQTGTVAAATVTLTDTRNAQPIDFTGTVTIGALNTAPLQGYNVRFRDDGTIGGATTFSNTGSLIIDNGLTFSNGVTATAPTKTITDTVTATAGNIDFGTTTTDIAGTAGLTGVGTITLGPISSAGATDYLTLTNTTGSIGLNGNIGSAGAELDELSISKSGGTATFADGQSVYVVSLQTNSAIYGITINSDTFIVSGAGSTSFLNSGTLSLGNGTLDQFTFAAGLTATDPSSTTLTGTILTSNAPVNLGALALGGTSIINTVNAGTGGNISVAAISNSTARDLTLTAGTAGDIAVSGSVGNTTALGAISIVSANDATFDSTINAASLTQTAGTGTTTFSDNITVSAAGTAVDIANSAITLDGLTVSSTNAGNGPLVNAVSLSGPVALTGGPTALSTVSGGIVFSSTINGNRALAITAGTGLTKYPVSCNDRIGGLAGVANKPISLTVTGSTVNLHSIGDTAVVPQYGVNGPVTIQATGLVTLFEDDYRSTGAQAWTSPVGVVYRANASGTWTAGGAGITLTASNTDLYLDHVSCALRIDDSLTCRNLFFYRGSLDVSSWTLTTSDDFVVFGANYSPNDGDWTGADNRLAYYFTVTPSYYPAGWTYSAATHVLALSGLPSEYAAFTDLNGASITIGTPAGSNPNGGNLYVNGADINAGNVSLNISANGNSHPIPNVSTSVSQDQWGIPYAVVFNLTVANANATGGYVAAAVPVLDPDGAGPLIAETNQNVSFGPGNTGNWQTVRPNIATVQTVYDDVIEVNFNIPIENSNGEINTVVSAAAAAIANGSAWYTETFPVPTPLKFANAYFDPDCTNVLDGTDGDVSTIYLRVNQTNPNYRWNTDATGTSIGDAGSTDRGRGTTAAGHRTTRPDLSFLKGLFSAANGKTMCANYGANTAPAFTATTDHCAPVLVEVFTGQEAHVTGIDDAAKNPYDAHNFIEFRWSEPVTMATSGPAVADNAVNLQVDAACGAIAQVGPNIDVAGFATIPNARLSCGTRAHNTTVGTPSNLVHAIYRNFSLDGVTAAADQPQRLRVSIAGWADAVATPEYYWYWPGYIQPGAETPSDLGAVSDSATGYVFTDTATTPNALETFGAASYARATVTVQNDPAGLYGPWDVTGPAPAAFRSATDVWSDPVTVYEAVPDATGGLIDRIEMHFFDNAVDYSTTTDSYAWYSRRGWYDATDATKTILGQTSAEAPEAFGGSRPEDPPVSEWVTTSGGIRESSLNQALAAFRVFYNGAIMVAMPNEYSTNVGSKLLAPLTNQNVAGDPYFMLFWSAPGGSGYQIAGSSITLSYNTDGNPTTGYVTDLAGNLMQSFSRISCVDRTPPRMTFTLAGVNRTDLYVLFSKPIDFASPAAIASGLEVNLSGTPVALSGLPEVRSANNRAFLYRLATPVTAANLVNPASTVAIAWDGGTIFDPVTGTWTQTSYFIDELGNYAVVGDSHRLSDIGVGLADVLYGSDGVNEPGLLGTEGGGALRSEKFDGTGRLLDKDITIATKINLPSAPGSLSLFYDVNPDANTMPLTFNEASGSSLELWLPSVISGFNRSGNQDARNLSPVETTNDKLFRNFLIPESDAEVVPGAKVQFVLQYEGLFCARLTDESDITSLAPWSFVVAETRHQRGGVTILNNVIDSDKREKTIVQVEVPKTGTIVIQVFTLDGNIVKVLERGRKGGGTYSYYWDGTNGAGNPVARGIYFIRVVGPGMDEIRKVMVVRD